MSFFGKRRKVLLQGEALTIIKNNPNILDTYTFRPAGGGKVEMIENGEAEKEIRMIRLNGEATRLR